MSTKEQYLRLSLQAGQGNCLTVAVCRVLCCESGE